MINDKHPNVKKIRMLLARKQHTMAAIPPPFEQQLPGQYATFRLKSRNRRGMQSTWATAHRTLFWCGFKKRETERKQKENEIVFCIFRRGSTPLYISLFPPSCIHKLFTFTFAKPRYPTVLFFMKALSGNRGKRSHFLPQLFCSEVLTNIKKNSEWKPHGSIKPGPCSLSCRRQTCAAQDI